MPAPTVQMGLGGTWPAVAASHAPDAHVVCAMRTYRIFTGSWTTRLFLSYPSEFASGYEGMEPRQGYGIINCVDVNKPSNFPGGGLSVSLDGVDDYIEYTTISGQGTNPASLELLLSYSTAPGAGEVIFVSGDNDFGLAIHDDGRIYGYYGLSAVVDTALSTGTIHHVALVRSGAATDAITLYLNGVSVDTASIARATLAGFFWRAGINLAASAYHGVSVYGFAQHGTALTSGQVTASYNATQWTDVTGDTKGAASLVIERGIRDDGPSSRVASTGTLSFSMNNLASNSGGATGYYSPGHASCRTGFGKGTPVRVLSGSDEIFRGRIRSIAPTPGKTGGNLTKVFATDYLDSAGVSLMDNATVMESVSAHEVLANVIGFVPESPNGVVLFAGSDLYTLALDNTRDESVTALSEMHRLAMSELGQIYVRRDGVLVFENRSARVATSPTASVTLNDTMHDLDVAEVSASSLNRVQVTVHPRVIDSAATTVLYELVNPLQLGAGETKVIIGPFRAATATGITTRVGGLSMVAPVATTDYTMNTASDDTGTVLTSSLTVTADYGPNGVKLTLTNGSTDAAYVTKMQCRGKGVYDFRTVVLRAQNDAAIASDGVNALNVDMVYQEDPDVGQAMANLLLAGYGDLAGTRARTVSFYPDAAGMPAGLWTKDVSDRVAVSETVTGATGEYYINGVKHEYQNGTLPRITWWLSPAEPVSYWVLDTSTLDETTMLGV